MRGTISPANPWDVMVDLFFYREPEEAKEEEEPEAVTYPTDNAGYTAGSALPGPRRVMCLWSGRRKLHGLVDLDSSHTATVAACSAPVLADMATGQSRNILHKTLQVT